MNLVHLLRVGKLESSLLENLCAAIPRSFSASCRILPAEFDPAPHYHPERQQYHSSEILEHIQPLMYQQALPKHDGRLLAVTAVDLYIPILKYVFGEALMGGPCAIVSLHRLRQEFYGLDPDASVLNARLLKECIHELGHTLNLAHCQDYRCAMASAHSVEWIDLRESRLCDSCRSRVESKSWRSGF